MTNLKQNDVNRLNRQQMEMRLNLPSLYISMIEASNGNSNNLELQIMRKRILEQWKIDTNKPETKLHEYVVLMNKDLNHMLIKLKENYCGTKAYDTPAQYNGLKMGAKTSNKVFDAWEIESMLINYILYFPFQFVPVTDDLSVNVPPLEKFIGENDEHSNNKLVKYIKSNFEKQVVIPKMNADKKVQRLMKNGKTYYIKQEIQSVLFEDMTPPQSKSTDNPADPITFNDVIVDENPTLFYGDDEDKPKYGKQKDANFIFNNFKEVLTADQLEKFNILLAAIKENKIDILDLFHPITNKLNKEALGRVLFLDKDNNYIQPAVSNMLKSMRKRMDKELDKQGFNKVEIRSDYVKFHHLSASENKLYIDYKIESKYLIKTFEIEENDIYKNVNFYKPDQIIPQSEIDKIQNGEQTVSDLIRKFNLDKNIATQRNGVLTVYKPSGNGEVLIDHQEKSKLLETHCKGLWIAVLEGRIKFKLEGDWMLPTNFKDKIVRLTVDEYNTLKNRLIFSLDVMEIIKKRMNWDKFCLGSHHELVDKVELNAESDVYKYLDAKNLSFVNIIN